MRWLVTFTSTLCLFDFCEPISNGCFKNYSENVAQIDAMTTFSTLNFQPKWIRDKHFWMSTEFNFEGRYKNQIDRKNDSQFLNIFVIPFSHNDPGWLKTYEVYFYSQTKKILNNAVAHLSKNKNMTFAWSEICFLSKWWSEASRMQKESLQQLVNEGRFEILTGGWVMPDEATTTVYGLVSQLVEGHQWIHNHLKIHPVSAWSLDPFGHGSTMPYLLNKAGITGMMIQRVHYAWKHFFAETRQSDFIWLPRWSSNEDKGIMCHNAHYDLYPTKHSCGPHPTVCLRFDFRHSQGARRKEEHLYFMEPVNSSNIETLGEALLGQYARTASLTNHKVVVTTLGGDFRFDTSAEWTQQYGNYTLLFDYINSKRRQHVKFGTLSEYFEEVRSRNVSLPKFSGDLFPYSDVIFPFAPGYWTGFYSTRPFWKKLCREAEDELVKADLLFTIAYNLMRQNNYSMDVLSRYYDNLVHARRSVALFQHHDGITGTSPRAVMLDSARKLTQAWNFCRLIQRIAIETIWKQHLGIHIPPLQMASTATAKEKVVTRLYENQSIVKKVVIFNSLAWKRETVVRLILRKGSSDEKQLVVKDQNGNMISAQVNNVIDFQHGEKVQELSFMAELPPLSIITYEIHRHPTKSFHDNDSITRKVLVNCYNCNITGESDTRKISEEAEAVLMNDFITVVFDKSVGQLKSIRMKNGVKANVSLSFGKYEALYGSGAYLLHPITSSFEPIFRENATSVYVTRGSITSDVVTRTRNYIVKTWISNKGSRDFQSVVHVSVQVAPGSTELPGDYFMRLQSDLDNTEFNNTSNNPKLNNKTQPIFYTDTNGFAVEKRATLNNLPYHANHYPLTYFAHIQDPQRHLRLSLLTDRAHGVGSPVQGRLEVLFDRRLLYNDARGIAEGVLDSEEVISNYIIKLENISGHFSSPGSDYSSWEPTLDVQHASKNLNHPPAIFMYDALTTHRSGSMSFFSKPFPANIHLLNLAALESAGNQYDFKSVPSNKALLILQRLLHKTHVKCQDGNRTQYLATLDTNLFLNHSSVTHVSLGGTRNISHPNVSISSVADIPINWISGLGSFLLQF